MKAKTVQKQLAILQPIMRSFSLDTVRKGQNRLGELVASTHRKHVVIKDHAFEGFMGAWISPKDERRHGVILYLHGGGYACGDLDYAKGFATMLAVRMGTRVFASAYRLAPEHPFPAALEDAVTSYQYLLSKGYRSDQIALCGESAGGGLCYALCLKLREKGLPMPCGIVAISPWTDLTSSGISYQKNRGVDPTITMEKLNFYADHYTTERKNPLVSPLFADVKGMPPSLIFAGGDEIMLSDSEQMHQKLLKAGCISTLVVKEGRWHTYVTYGLEEDKDDIDHINRFLNQYLEEKFKLRWLRLDNAAKLFSATRRQNWSNVFRISATLTEEIDVPVMQSALDITARRFPSIAVRLRRGVFWYYLEQLPAAPQIREEHSYPMAAMSKRELRQSAIRVIVYKKRIAMEVFHAVTDGGGTLVFLKSLIAEYLLQKYGVQAKHEHGVVGRLEEPSAEEMEDSFLKYAGPVPLRNKEKFAWRIPGTPEVGGFLHLTCFDIPVKPLLEKAHEQKVTLTVILCAIMFMALQNFQKETVPEQAKRKPLKVFLPVNLRNLFPSKTLRNFALFTRPELQPRLGEYTFDEICKIVQHRMGLDVTQKHMSAFMAANVKSEKNLVVRMMPLFIKNTVLKVANVFVGERQSCITMSNLGVVRLPEEMEPYLARFDVILGIPKFLNYNCGVISYGDMVSVNFIRKVQEPGLEYHFHRALQEIGVVACVTSNRPERRDENDVLC